MRTDAALVCHGPRTQFGASTKQATYPEKQDETADEVWHARRKTSGKPFPEHPVSPPKKPYFQDPKAKPNEPVATDNDAMNLLDALLCIDPDQRPSAEEAEDDIWFFKNPVPQPNVQDLMDTVPVSIFWKIDEKKDWKISI